MRQQVPAIDALLGAQPVNLARWTDTAWRYGEPRLRPHACTPEAGAGCTSVWGGDAVLNDTRPKPGTARWLTSYLPRWTRHVTAALVSLRRAACRSTEHTPPTN